jgi:hypothetical protein
MAIQVSVGPPLVIINRADTFALAEPDCSILPDTDQGIYMRDTRSVSGHDIFADGEHWVLQNSGAIAYYASRQAILGLDAHAHKKSVYADPELPHWLPEITLHNLRVGESTITLRFWKENNEPGHQGLAFEGDLVVQRHSSPRNLPNRERSLPTASDSKITENAD